MRTRLLAVAVVAGLFGAPLVAPAYAGPGGDPPCAFQRDSCSANHVYVVRRGDWLWKIARNHIAEHSHRPGDRPAATVVKRHADAIYRANRSTIGPDPGKIRPGMRLVMPNP